MVTQAGRSRALAHASRRASHAAWCWAESAAAGYYSDPAAVLIDYQGTRVVAFAAPAGSGARYAAAGVELWEHQGTAAFTWRGQQLQCPRTRVNSETHTAASPVNPHP